MKRNSGFKEMSVELQQAIDDRHISIKLFEQGYTEIHKDDPKPVDSSSVAELKKRDINTLSPIELTMLGFAQLEESKQQKEIVDTKAKNGMSEEIGEDK